jgi:hypothetical protein
MNIVEAYIKFKGQLVIFISGMSGCGKIDVGKFVSRDFKIGLLEQQNYYKENYGNQVTLPSGESVTNYSTDEAFDWDKLNADIESRKKDGVVVVGVALVSDKITTVPDFHIHLAISKKACLERRKIYVEQNKDKYPEEYKSIESGSDRLKMNQLIFPYYLEVVKRQKIDKYISIEGKDDNPIYDEVYNYLIESIEGYLYKNKENKDGKDKRASRYTNKYSNVTNKREAKRAKDCEKAIDNAGKVVAAEWMKRQGVTEDSD